MEVRGPRKERRRKKGEDRKEDRKRLMEISSKEDKNIKGKKGKGLWEGNRDKNVRERRGQIKEKM
jgi:hypothetical protein